MIAPKIVKKLPKVVQVKDGESTILEVKATGKPTPTPKWLIANEEIIPSDDYLIENYPDGTSVLTITNVQSEAIDKITFEAISRAGVAKTTTKLQIVEGRISIKWLRNVLAKLFIVCTRVTAMCDNFGSL